MPATIDVVNTDPITDDDLLPGEIYRICHLNGMKMNALPHQQIDRYMIALDTDEGICVENDGHTRGIVGLTLKGTPVHANTFSFERVEANIRITERNDA